MRLKSKRPDRSRVEKILRDYFTENRPDAIVVYLFGSVARDMATRRSDVDVGVLFDEDPPPTFAGLHLDLEGDLERLLGHPTQLVVLNRAPADLVHRVLRDGSLIVDRDPSRRVRFEVKSRNEYFDLAPIRHEYRWEMAT